MMRKFHAVFLCICCMFRSASNLPHHRDRQTFTTTGVRFDQLRHYEVVVPTAVDQNGQFISYDLSRPVQSSATGRPTRAGSAPRARRSVDPAEEHVFYRLSAYGTDFRLTLTLNQGLVAANYLTEEWRESGVMRRLSRARRCHYIGRIANIRASRVAVSNCEGLHGVLATRTEEYFVEPLYRDFTAHLGESGYLHIVYKRSAIKLPDSDRPCGVQDGSGDLFDWRIPQKEQEFNELFKSHDFDHKKEDAWRERFVQKDMKRENQSPSFWRENLHGGFERDRARRSASRERHVETLVVADKTMAEYHGVDQIESYILTIMNIVAELFRHHSIRNQINIVITKLLILTDDQPDLTINHHADHTLESFCRWQKTIKIKETVGGLPIGRHDNAILITRNDICAYKNAPCGTLGLAPVAGMCEAERSCSVNEDVGLASAFTIAHELGHSFGMQHDGFGNECGMKSPAGIMASQLTKHTMPFTWSACSAHYITSFLDSGRGQCLDNSPHDDLLNSVSKLPGELHDGNEQCRMQFGANSTQCKYGEVCRELWCIGKSRRCVTNSVPAADGTNCSENGVTSGWCYKGECVRSGWQPIPVDGGWSQWSPWAACSRSCGGGVMFMERLCTKPKPSHGGKYCIGERKKFRSCNTQNCPQNGTDFRLLQCREFNRKPFRGKVYKWRPYSGEQINPCALTCLAEGFNFYTERAPKVIDGTKCFADTRDICVDGVCRHVGCDGILGSEVEEDNCRLCGGDGSTCTTVSGSFMKPLRKGTYEEVVIVPQGSVNVLIQEVVTSQNYIALKSTSTNHFYINGKWTIDWPGKVDVSNTVFQYERSENKPEVLRARGPTTEEVAVMILLQEENKGLKYQFNIPLPKQGRDPGLYYMWEYGYWTGCSTSCGGGVRRSEAVCVQEDRQEQAQTEQCHGHLRPNQKTKPCNVQPCPPRWQAGRWSACSQTCGSGTRERSIICMRKINRHKDEVMRAAECAEQKPITTQICNTKECPAVWVKSRWSLCSSRCGPGFKRRRVRCMSADHREYLPNKRCQDSQRRPPNKTRCNLQKCPPPAWKTGSWTKCSAECGPGKQRRSVACRTFTGKSSKQCDVTLKPANQKRCEGPCRQVANFSKKECVDRNKVAYCPLVLKFKFCDREYFQQMCCQTCRHHNS